MRGALPNPEEPFYNWSELPFILMRSISKNTSGNKKGETSSRSFTAIYRRKTSTDFSSSLLVQPLLNSQLRQFPRR